MVIWLYSVINVPGRDFGMTINRVKSYSSYLRFLRGTNLREIRKLLEMLF